MEAKSAIRTNKPKPKPAPFPDKDKNRDYSIKMKKPFLYNAEPLKTDVKPILVRGPYDVYVGAINEDNLPQYVIINRDTGVVESTNEVYGFITDWLGHFVKETDPAVQLNAQLNLGLNS